jgi:hypothetical protein
MVASYDVIMHAGNGAKDQMVVRSDIWISNTPDTAGDPTSGFTFFEDTEETNPQFHRHRQRFSPVHHFEARTFSVSHHIMKTADMHRNCVARAYCSEDCEAEPLMKCSARAAYLCSNYTLYSNESKLHLSANA